MPDIASPPERAPPLAARLLAVVRETWSELRGGAGDTAAIGLASSLDRDLGFDSLSRMELLLRVERAFGVALPEDTLEMAETVGDLLRAIQRGAAPAAAVADEAQARLPRDRPESEGDDTAAAATTLLEVLECHLRAHPDATQVVVLREGGEERLSYRALAEAGGRMAAGLQRHGVRPRETVAIMLPTGTEYFATFLGVVMAGAVPVPIYPPARPSQLEDHVLRHAAILENAQAVALVTAAEAALVATLLRARVASLRQVHTPEQLAAATGEPQPVAVHADDLALLQYTSGSTGRPKGVMLTHANLLANIRAMAQAIGATPRDVFVSWLPLYHDMGLIGAWLGSLYVGFPLVVMPPTAFLARPVRWLEAIGRWGGTLSAAPNFAYELCLKRVDDAALARLDLRSWRVAFNGAEPVRPATVRAFGERFAACGFRPEAMCPVYGLAECSVGLLFPPLGRPPPVDAVRRAALAGEGRAEPAADDDPSALRFVGCGRALPGHAVRIVDRDGREVPERIEGRLEFRGPSATRGYYRDAEKTAQLVRGGWLDTGDRAYAAGGDIYLTGRVKDIVIRGGRNIYPEEIEEAVGRVDGVRRGCVAVFGSPDAATGTERLVVMAEVRPLPEPRRAAVREAVRDAVLRTIGEPPDDVVLARPHTVLKTSSGKVRRSACRALYEQGQATRTARPVRLQLLRLAAGAVLARLRALPGALVRTFTGAWIASVFCVLAPPAWALTLLARSPAHAWSIARAAALAYLTLAGMRPRVRGLQRLPAGACVLVSNHASYLDGVILLAALPRPCAFVAKRELATQFFAGPFLRRLGTVFVERFHAPRAVEDAALLAEAAASGRSLMVFPEGTFVAGTGLLPFHLGAFVAAAQAQVAVVPVAIRGSREALPAGRWLPRRALLEVEVGEPLPPVPDRHDLFARAVRLRDAARQAIAAAIPGEG